MVGRKVRKSVSYTHLTLPTNREVAGYFNNKSLGELGFFSMKVALYLEDFL